MTKQEKIIEGIGHVITVNRPYIANKIAYKIAEYLHSQGVVIKVEEWLPTRKGMVCTVNPLIEEING